MVNRTRILQGELQKGKLAAVYSRPLKVGGECVWDISRRRKEKGALEERDKNSSLITRNHNLISGRGEGRGGSGLCSYGEGDSEKGPGS